MFKSFITFESLQAVVSVEAANALIGDADSSRGLKNKGHSTDIFT